MPVRWSALKASQAADIIEEHINNASAPLNLASEEADKALRDIPDLPQYMEQHFRQLKGECQWAYKKLLGTVDRIRKDIPGVELAREQKRAEDGTAGSLFGEDEQLPEKICDDGTVAV